MATKIVTKETLKAMVSSNNREYVIKVIGRALLVLLSNQTREEVDNKTTLKHNGIGFTSSDANSGTQTALFYKKHNTLQDWQVNMWLRLDKNGQARIVKYHRQLNEAALAKQQLSMKG